MAPLGKKKKRLIILGCILNQSLFLLYIGSAKYIFTDTPDCEVVHGALYACLRALFGLSVIGILVSLFSGMLVYQLLGYIIQKEKKKEYLTKIMR